MTEKNTQDVKVLVGKDIKILGPGCPKCHQAEAVVKEALVESGVSAQVETITDTMKISEYGVFGTPAVVVDGEVKSVGKIPGMNSLRQHFTGAALHRWIALLLVVLIGGMTVFGSAIPCRKKTACSSGPIFTEKTCSSIPAPCRLKPCRLKQVFLLQNSQFPKDPKRTIDPLGTGLAAVPFPLFTRNPGWVSQLPNLGIPPTLSSPLFLLNSFFLC